MAAPFFETPVAAGACEDEARTANGESQVVRANAGQLAFDKPAARGAIDIGERPPGPDVGRWSEQPPHPLRAIARHGETSEGSVAELERARGQTIQRDARHVP